MTEQKQLLSFNYYKKGKPFTGSDSGMRYRIAKEGEEEEACFLVSVWPEPYCYEKTDREKITEVRRPFTKESFEGIAEYLNEMRKNGSWDF